VYHRVKGSSTTGGVTTYLHASCPAVWPGSMVGKQITWPSDTFEAYGSGEMSSKISSTDYAIGYIDSGHGHDDGLKEIALQNKAGTYQTSLEAGSSGIGDAATQAINQGVMPNSPTGDFSSVSLHNMDGSGTWPIVAISYVYIRKDLTQLGDRACLLKAFLEYIISDEGQALLPNFGAVGVPAAVKQISQAAIDTLAMPVCQEWAFEGSSTQAGSGQSDHVISLKRRDYGEYERGNLADASPVALADKLAALEAQVAGIPAMLGKIATLEAQVKNRPQPKPEPSAGGDDNSLVIVGVIISILAILVSTISMFATVWSIKQTRIAGARNAAPATGAYGVGGTVVGNPVGGSNNPTPRDPEKAASSA